MRKVSKKCLEAITGLIIKCPFFLDFKYLQPYLEEVVKEREEKAEWNKN
jgi:hypothetical protein